MNLILLLGRVLFGGFFLYNAWKHFKGARGMAAYAGSKGVPMPYVAVLGSGLLLLGGGLSFFFGIRPALGSLLLILFLVPVTLMMHAFWREEGDAKAMQKVQFAKNAALLGAALMLFVLYR